MTPLERVPSLMRGSANAWLHEIRANAVACEARRPHTRKPSKTGTINEASCLYLRALVDVLTPAVVVEIGTFIGTSALMLAAAGAHVYTCDKDNAAMTSTDAVTCYQKTTSTNMLLDLVSRGLVADLFFFDGRIQDDDLALIGALSYARTVYAFDDYLGREKGVINVGKLRPQLRGYRLIDPPAKTTIALIVPEVVA